MSSKFTTIELIELFDCIVDPFELDNEAKLMLEEIKNRLLELDKIKENIRKEIRKKLM